jgi:UDP-N-acetylglucosamine/UDP-N-acetylgalactosamine diphosphorylase
LPFMRRVAEEGLLTPHRSRKKVPFFKAGRLETPSEPNAWKLEKLLFDALAVAGRHEVVEVARALAFAPVKNPSGVDSAESALALMRARFVELLAEAGYETSAIPAARPVELAPEYLADPRALVARVAAGDLPVPQGDGALIIELP